MLILLQFLDDPFHGGVGSLEPEAMERTLVIIEEEMEVIGGDVSLPCDARGNPL
jgi:hypothetical protein